MRKVCNKCGYERQKTDSAPDYECPKCGAVYAKIEARLKFEAEELLRQKEREEKDNQEELVRRKEQEEREHQEAKSKKAKQKKIIAKTYTGKQAKATASFQMENIQLDCSACKSETSMKATKIPKFNTILRIIGFIIVIPSVLGIIIAIIMFISSVSATSEVMSTTQSNAAAAGATIGAAIGFGASIFVGCSSLVGGLIGWLLLMKKKVYKCFNCGFILDRA